MESLRDPGIAIESIRLLKAHIEIGDLQGKPEFDFRLAGMERRMTDDGKTMVLFASFDLMYGIEKPLFKFTCGFAARYKCKGEDAMPWVEFTDAMALAHIVPYLREFVSNMTNRMPVPVLILDPVNVHALIVDYVARKQAAQAKAAAPAPPV